MESLFNRVIDELKKRRHLKLLIPSTPVNVKFICDREEWLLTISREECILRTAKEMVKADLQIRTSKSVLTVLLDGDIRLHQLVKYGEVEMIGSYRQSLLVESILWLCRSFDHSKHEIA